jgi:hypothetical protein
MDFKPTIFVVEVNGEEYKFAAMTQRDMEKLVEAETAAAGDMVQLKKVNIEMLAHALRKGGMEVTADQIADSMPIPVYKSLLSAFMQAQGVKLEAKSKGDLTF